jgi:hypothetical protein
LIPRDSDLNFNDHYASSRVDLYSNGGKSNFLDRAIRSYVEFYTIDEMVMVLTGAIFVLGIIFLLSLYLNWSKSFIQGITMFLALIVMIYAVGIAVKVPYDRDLAVIVTAAESYFEPRTDSTVHFKLSEGMKAKILRAEGNWIKVRRSDGKVGWVPQDALERI